MCLDVYRSSNRNANKVIWWECHNGANQAWYIDRRPLHFPRYPLRDGIKFQIKTRMSGNRALFWHEHIGSHQYRLRIQNNNPGHNRQWWTFDWRTKTIRAFADRNKVISTQIGGQSWTRNGYNAVVRNIRSQWRHTQMMRFFGGSRRNIRNTWNKCLDVHGNHNSHHRHVIWWQCHNGANQGWYIDRVGYRYPPYPLGDGVKFQIKSRMPSNRALFWHEHIGSNQFRLRIRDNNPENNKQWFTFDSRTKTIRAWAKRSYVIANQQGYAFRIGVAATIRPYRNENYQRIRWYNGSRRNIRNNGQKCLDVHGGSNTHHRHVIFYNCHNGLNQAWYIDQRGVSYPRQPWGDSVKFQIRSKMSGGRALFWHEHIGSNQFRLRIRNHMPGEGKQWFVFNKRTRTIRSAGRRQFAISNQKGYGYRIGVAAVIRPWIGEIYQHVAYYGGRYRNVRNNGGKCLDVHGKHNSHHRHVIFWNCHNGANQGWVLDRRGVRYPKQPLPNGRRFQIKSLMPTNRALFWHEHIGSQQYRLRIRDSNSWNNRQWWIFDSRTRTIRPSADRRKVISGRQGYGFRNGMDAVVRHFRNQSNQKTAFYPGSRRNVRNNGYQCLDVHGASNTHMRHVIWYKCHNGLNQGWTIESKAKNYPRFPLNDGIKFQIKSLMSGRRALFWHEHIGSNQYRLRIRDNAPYDVKQWFVFDSRTRTIRAYSRRSSVIANQKGYRYRIGVAATVRPWANEVYQRIAWYGGSRRNIRNYGGKCLDVHGGHNHNNRHVIFWNCHNGLNQAWNVDQASFRFPRQPFGDNQKFMIRSRYAENRAASMQTHWTRGQYWLRIQDWNPEDRNQWFVFNRRTRTIRAWNRRSHAIGAYFGSRFASGRYAVLKPFNPRGKGQYSPQYSMLYYVGSTYRNLRTVGNTCLETHSYSHNQVMYFRKCRNSSQSRFYLQRSGMRYNRYPLRDGQLFQLRTRLRSNRPVAWDT